MRKLTVSQETFENMLKGIIASGVTFEATEKDGNVIVIFTGGF